jgi:hypothetical protein
MTLPVFYCCRRSAMNANSPKASKIPIALRRLFSSQLPAVLDRKSVATWIAQAARPDASLKLRHDPVGDLLINIRPHCCCS